jgi:bifunctional non-homologous end joining protein LigD
MLESVCNLGLEGIVSKVVDSPYRAGRSHDWLKTKCVVSETLAVAGFTENDCGGIDGILLGRADGDGAWGYAGTTSHGLGADDLAELERRLRRLKTSRSPLADPPKGKIAWTKPDVLVEVTYPNKTGNGRLRHSRFKGFRDDLLKPRLR